MDGAGAELERLLRRLRIPDDARRKERSLTGAAIRGDLELVRVFLESGADLEERSIGFASPLQAAAGAGQVGAVELLLERGADPREKPEAVFSPLSAAAGHGHLSIVRALIAAIGDLSSETKSVAQAAAQGRHECLELLLDKGAPLGEHAGHTLRATAWAGHLACVRRLLRAGVDPRSHPDYARDLVGEPVESLYLPRQAALDNGHEAVARVLDGLPLDADAEREHAVRRGAEPSLADLARALRPKRKNRDDAPLAAEARATALLDALEIVRAGGQGGWSARDGGAPWLALATETGEAEIVSALIEHGVSLEAGGEGDRSALWLAADLGRADLVALLLGKGADAGRAAADRVTPLMAAAQSGDRACVAQLLEAGADPRVRVRGRSAVGFASGPHKSEIRALIEARVRAARGSA